MKNSLKKLTKLKAATLVVGLFAGACAHATTYTYRVPAQGVTGVYDLYGGGGGPAAVPVNTVATAALGMMDGALIKTDGTLWTSGRIGGKIPSNTGDPIVARTSFAQIAAPSKFIAVAIGQDNASYLRDDGTIWTTGMNSYGQLGDGTTNASTGTLTQVVGTNKYVDVSVGYQFTIGLKNDGTIWGSGWSASGEFGYPGNTTVYKPVTLQGGASVVFTSIGAARDGAHALTIDGTLWGVGRNDGGGVGNGTWGAGSMQWVFPWQPLNVGGQKIKKFAVGNWKTIALDVNGQLWGTGNNAGELGVATPTNTAGVWVQGAPGHVFTDIAYAGDAVLALKSDGSVWASGKNTAGQFGNGSAVGTVTTSFIRVDSGQGPFVKVMGTNENDAGFLLHQDGSLWAAGTNSSGQIGMGTTGRFKTWTKVPL